MFQLGWASSEDRLGWLHRCPNLIECEIAIYEGLDTELSSSSMAHLPRLIKLKIWKEYEDVLGLEAIQQHCHTCSERPLHRLRVHGLDSVGTRAIHLLLRPTGLHSS